MFTTYRRVLALPGALAFSMSGLVARLPISMVSLGIVLLVSTRTGSYSLAGAVSASYLIASALFAVAPGPADRPARAEPGAAGRPSPSSRSALIAADDHRRARRPRRPGRTCAPRWPAPRCRRSARASGPAGRTWCRTRPACTPPSPSRRSSTRRCSSSGRRWSPCWPPRVHPLAGLTCAIVATVLGTAVLVSQRRTEPPASGGAHRHTAGPMPWPVLAPLIACAFTMGALLGGAEVATVAFSDELGAKPLSGLMLAVWALGSLLSGAGHRRAAPGGRRTPPGSAGAWSRSAC